jgi:hypothetical protein
MIVVRLFEGLGNQMFQYAMGRALAHRYQVPLRMDESWFYGDQWGDRRQSPRRSPKLNCFHIEAERASETDLAFCRTQRRLLPRLRDMLLRGGRDMWPQIVEWTKPELPANKPGLNLYVDGYWQSETFFKDVESTIRREFQLRQSDSTRQAASEMQSYRGDGRPLVSVHVRRGDLVPVVRDGVVTKNFGPPTSVGYVRRAMAKFDPHVRFVVVAEPAERDWCRQNIQAENVVFFAGQDEMADFAMLSMCDHNIIANSTFSWWAAWLNANPHKQVIAPRQWYWPDRPANRIREDRIPTQWTVLDSE